MGEEAEAGTEGVRMIKKEETGFYVESHATSGVEQWILKYCCEPISKRIPASITPNTISLFDFVVVWMTFVAAAAAPYLSPTNGMIARFLAALGTFVYLVGDSLDGLHARRTGQTSKLGEVIDHGLDSMGVPLSAAAMALTLQLDPWLVALSVVTTTMHYHAQLVVYHHTRIFVHPPTNGPDAQVGVIALYVAFGLLFYFVPPSTRWMSFVLPCVVGAAVLVNVRVEAFFLQRLGGLYVPHAVFVLMMMLCSAAYVGGAMNAYVFVLAVSLVSFRIIGTYVLRSVLDESFDGNDWVIPTYLVLATVAYHLPGMDDVFLFGWAVRDGLFYPLFAYVLLRNLVDLHRGMPRLRGENEQEEPSPPSPA